MIIKPCLETSAIWFKVKLSVKCCRDCHRSLMWRGTLIRFKSVVLARASTSSFPHNFFFSFPTGNSQEGFFREKCFVFLSGREFREKIDVKNRSIFLEKSDKQELIWFCGVWRIWNFHCSRRIFLNFFLRKLLDRQIYFIHFCYQPTIISSTYSLQLLSSLRRPHRRQNKSKKALHFPFVLNIFQLFSMKMLNFHQLRRS